MGELGDIPIYAGSAILAAGVAFGIVKGRLKSFVTYDFLEVHCQKRDSQVDKSLGEIHTDIKELLRSVGKIEGKIDG